MSDSAILSNLNSTIVPNLLQANTSEYDVDNATSILTTLSSTTISSSTPSPSPVTTSLTNILSSTLKSDLASPVDSKSTSTSGLLLFSLIIFIVATALIGKIIASKRKKRSDLIGGSARWRLAASQQSGSGPSRTAANYAPMDTRRPGAPGGLDAPGPDRNLDWERQFFDDSEPVINVVL
ncbi:unnamed protein product [Auanema sp. JU1783]|nr:unnamed protein product [Auanema sp. JU1783]